jgi:hypothetical protein
MGRVYWFPTEWNVVPKRPGSKLLARRVARRGTSAFKVLVPRRWELQTSEGLLVITQKALRYVPEAMYVYTVASAFRERHALAPLWIDVHALENCFQWCNPFWATAVPRAIHSWPAENDPGEYLDSRDQ